MLRRPINAFIALPRRAHREALKGCSTATQISSSITLTKADPRFEFIGLTQVNLVRVVAPDFLPFAVSDSITPEQMRDQGQCIIRDTARHRAPLDYYVIEGARSGTVSGQFMKKEGILQEIGWGAPAGLPHPGSTAFGAPSQYRRKISHRRPCRSRCGP
jgi:hypothetical protein